MEKGRRLFRDRLKEDLKKPGFKKEYEEIGPEVQLAIEIAEMRERLGMTQKELAKAVGTAQTNISRIERAGHNLTIAYLIRIAKALNSELQVHLVPHRGQPA